jgi:2-iminobutanoate/2-iminopropanoate deaminase
MAGDRQCVNAPGAPAAVGPYSHAVVYELGIGSPPTSPPTSKPTGLLFCSGQIPLDPVTGELVGESAAEQARRCLENLQAVCEAAGTTLGRAVKLTVYMTDLGEFAAVNEVYGSFFAGSEPPARVAVEVSGLPKGAQVEIDAVVATGG